MGGVSVVKTTSSLGCCDGYLPLHRSEGFGRGMAEALQLGLDVIATNWSGNIDFLKGELAHPIPVTFTDLKPGQYKHWANQYWAEPNYLEAINAMRRVERKRRKNGIPPLSCSEVYRNPFQH